MWFEVLPSFGIIVAFMALPTFAMYGIHSLVIGNPYRRNLDQRFDRAMFMRDTRLTGSAYKMNGLDAVPDKDEK